MQRKVFYAALAGEIVLKSDRVRRRFEKRLLSNLLSAFKKYGVQCTSPKIEWARVIAACKEDRDYTMAISAATHTFGIHGATTAYEITYENLSDLALRVRDIAADWVKGKKFAVRARRSGVEGFTSLDVAREVGAALYNYSAGVDLDNPEVEVFVEVRGRKAYVHRGFVKGPGGLPIGVEGRAIALFSGGLDSPVAAWMAAKRGIEVDLLHFILASTASVSDALRVGSRLAKDWLHGYSPKLYVVDFRLVTEAIRSSVRRDYAQVVLRLAMFDASQLFAEKLGYHAIYTGESVGQVSSQTLRNIYAIAKALPLYMPLLRPLAGLDKEEIMDIGRRIGIYEEAAKTKEYCRLGEGPVTTAADPVILHNEYNKIRDIVAKTVEDYTEYNLLD
ncbi:tRNA 4-thiouridine(8) synthase ThiI [Pyrofollis japonicus]|uniref:tRNA sulfurtransferase n=1 Tax=Pyrofollis japonicus TaxID=3060460 RepID=UPI00295B3527|nr:tRNA sulfurtransferase [Pyrofollis japonicus]BEP18489.1 tRNA 4-thiouridine(8) synthase ThiI [Pyrofollis japonicus]